MAEPKIITKINYIREYGDDENKLEVDTLDRRIIRDLRITQNPKTKKILKQRLLEAIKLRKTRINKIYNSVKQREQELKRLQQEAPPSPPLRPEKEEEVVPEERQDPEKGKEEEEEEEEPDPSPFPEKKEEEEPDPSPFPEKKEEEGPDPEKGKEEAELPPDFNKKIDTYKAELKEIDMKYANINKTNAQIKHLMPEYNKNHDEIDNLLDNPPEITNQYTVDDYYAHIESLLESLNTQLQTMEVMMQTKSSPQQLQTKPSPQQPGLDTDPGCIERKNCFILSMHPTEDNFNDFRAVFNEVFDKVLFNPQKNKFMEFKDVIKDIPYVKWNDDETEIVPNVPKNILAAHRLDINNYITYLNERYNFIENRKKSNKPYQMFYKLETDKDIQYLEDLKQYLAGMYAYRYLTQNTYEHKNAVNSLKLKDGQIHYSINNTNRNEIVENIKTLINNPEVIIKTTSYDIYPTKPENPGRSQGIIKPVQIRSVAKDKLPTSLKWISKYGPGYRPRTGKVEILSLNQNTGMYSLQECMNIQNNVYLILSNEAIPIDETYNNWRESQSDNNDGEGGEPGTSSRNQPTLERKEIQSPEIKQPGTDIINPQIIVGFKKSGEQRGGAPPGKDLRTIEYIILYESDYESDYGSVKNIVDTHPPIELSNNIDLQQMYTVNKINKKDYKFYSMPDIGRVLKNEINDLIKSIYTDQENKKIKDNVKIFTNYTPDEPGRGGNVYRDISNVSKQKYRKFDTDLLYDSLKHFYDTAPA